MTILSSSSSITRYRLVNEPPRELLAEVPDRLVKHAFQDIDHTADERSFGWVSADDMLDAAWRTAPPEKGAYFHFALRLDTRRVSPAVFKKHYQLAVNQYLESIQDQEKKFVSKDRKDELREQVMLRLRARSLPVPAVFDVIWNIADNTILLESVNTKVRTLFEDFFTLTFELALEPMTPFFLATRLMGEEALTRLENIEPTSFAG